MIQKITKYVLVNVSVYGMYVYACMCVCHGGWGRITSFKIEMKNWIIIGR